jgi:hypothetical protein
MFASAIISRAASIIASKTFFTITVSGFILGCSKIYAPTSEFLSLESNLWCLRCCYLKADGRLLRIVVLAL